MSAGMPRDDMEAVVRRLYDEVMNRGDLAVAEELGLLPPPA